MNTQHNDPKGAAGALKTPLGFIPPYAMDQTAWAHKLGAEKYGPFNWRDTGVCASTYVNAIMRHLNAWRDGEDLDPESGISHLAHIACSCNILLDADYCDTLQDDRNVLPNADIKSMSASEHYSDSVSDEQKQEPEEIGSWRGMYREYAPLLNALEEIHADNSGYSTLDELQTTRRKILCGFYVDNNSYSALDEGTLIQEGDEYYDSYESEWVKSLCIGLPISGSRLLYRRPIKQQYDSACECECGRYKINHYTLGEICEDCDLQWQDPYCIRTTNQPKP
jgi:hypothetical protein